MPYSNYTKIRDLLQEVDRLGVPTELDALAETVRGREIESFAIWRAPDPESPPVKTYCSTEAIRRLIRFTRDLGLLAIDDQDLVSLTRPGQNALAAGNYDKVLSTHLAMYLKETVGVTYSDIKDVLASIRRPEVPSFETIFRKLQSSQQIKVPEDHFRAVLYLLERCGMLTTQIRKIYFAPELKL